VALTNAGLSLLSTTGQCRARAAVESLGPACAALTRRLVCRVRCPGQCHARSLRRVTFSRSFPLTTVVVYQRGLVAPIDYWSVPRTRGCRIVWPRVRGTDQKIDVQGALSWSVPRTLSAPRYVFPIFSVSNCSGIPSGLVAAIDYWSVPRTRGCRIAWPRVRGTDQAIGVQGALSWSVPRTLSAPRYVFPIFSVSNCSGILTRARSIPMTFTPEVMRCLLPFSCN
jgi:hypothetical protein